MHAHQSNLISPYIFNLCANGRFSNIIERKKRQNPWQSRSCKEGPIIGNMNAGQYKTEKNRKYAHIYTHSAHKKGALADIFF